MISSSLAKKELSDLNQRALVLADRFAEGWSTSGDQSAAQNGLQEAPLGPSLLDRTWHLAAGMLQKVLSSMKRSRGDEVFYETGASVVPNGVFLVPHGTQSAFNWIQVGSIVMMRRRQKLYVYIPQTD